MGRKAVGEGVNISLASNGTSMGPNPDEKMAVNCLKLIQQYAWLLNAFMLDFYTKDHWRSLPSTWKEVLSQITLEELGEWMGSEMPCRHVFPLSLLALRASVKAHSLSREQISLFDKYTNNENNSAKAAGSCGKLIPGKETDCLQHDNLKQLFVRHVKPKKRHETEVMAKLCAEAALESRVECIVDVGGGKGHLSRLIAYGYGLRVCCVEAQSSLLLSAREIDKQIEYTASKYLKDSYVQDLPKPEYVAMTVSNSDESLNQFRQEVFNKVRRYSEEKVSFGIVGLHPCGDLAPTLLHLFANLEEAKFICIASCCYMKLSFNGCDEVRGYPISNFFQKLPQSLTTLTYEALEVSCHAQEAYCQRLQMHQYHVLKIHCFRAVLEKLMVKHRPDLKHTGLRSVKRFDEMDFSSYAKKALDRIDISIPVSDLTSSETAKQLGQWQDVVAFYSLRLLLAPLVESAVILDRLFFLHEQGGHGCVIPGFDPLVSPRNLILQGQKIHQVHCPP